MTVYRIRGVGNSVPLDVGRAGAGDSSDHPEAAHDQAAVRNLYGADDAIDALPDEIHQVIALTDLKVEAEDNRSRNSVSRGSRNVRVSRGCASTRNRPRGCMSRKAFSASSTSAKIAMQRW